MDLQLRGRTALVTGASQGIEKALARLLALEGVRVVAAARRVDLVKQLALDVAGEGSERILPIEVDLYEDGSAEKLAAATKSQIDRVDILMNVAGGSRTVPMQATNEQWYEAMRLNSFACASLPMQYCPRCRPPIGAA
jgi:3-oxoacyl-[acyl-carrier protein] reductase